MRGKPNFYGLVSEWRHITGWGCTEATVAPCMAAMRCLLLLLALLLPLRAVATESAPVASPRATATLLADRAAIAPGDAFRLMLRLRLAPGWHT